MKRKWEPTLQVKRQTAQSPRGKAGKRKLGAYCKRLKGEHVYIWHGFWPSWSKRRVWIDIRCKGCGKKHYIIKPDPMEEQTFFRKMEYTQADFKLIEKFEGDLAIFDYES